ncbi:C6 transcription factor [Colletotrichum higginsianum IMI 349063]|uniref:C6 transcription factor n=1 Tax=Colletotrichum higginsianum (strain IMI 349063) TaxID=759273 RepID=A0A1B7XWC5_COLHI|nr:C6 transcription factor [Colletotrichum higginsianum IMI 349063]OBR04053.1 C6 transcription factor [Colletotrichum higginsianum IMI 349063]
MDAGAETQRTTQNSGIKVRRPRAARACDLCRAKKNKCDELYPCTYCKSQDMSRRLFTPEYVRQLEEQVKRLSAIAESVKAPSTDDNASAMANTAAPEFPDGYSPDDRGLQRRLSRSTAAGGSPSNAARSRNAAGQEISGVNRHTRNVEFYGSSSSVALLSHVQRTGDDEPVISPDLGSDAGTLLSNLHNPAFSSPSATDQVQTQTQTPGGASSSTTTAADAAFTTAEARSSTRPTTHYPQCRHFLQSFFSSIHYVHPILDRKLFFDRCEELWARPGDVREPSSFVALYYSILSLGALVGVREDEPVDGVGNLQWSRRFFDEAKRRCDQLGMVTDLEMVQCYFFLAKVCQNELNAHCKQSVMCLAWVVHVRRTRGEDSARNGHQPRTRGGCQKGTSSAQSRVENVVVRSPMKSEEVRGSLTVVPGAYIHWKREDKAEANFTRASDTLTCHREMSFSMGRPDTLGADLYHNRLFPVIGEAETESSAGGSELVDPPSCAIIKCMVDYSKIIRSICLGIYLPETTVPRTVQLAHQIDQDLQRWAEDLPEAIRPTTSVEPRSLKSVREAQWMKRQRLVLTMRFLNIRILLFGSIILTSTSAERASIPGSQEGIHLCLEAAKQTIEIIYQTYQHHDFFRTWYVIPHYQSQLPGSCPELTTPGPRFYNTTYTVFAASMILVYVTQEATEAEAPALLKLVAMAIEILETMDECVVALRSAKLLHKAIEKAEKRFSASASSTPGAGAGAAQQQQQQQQQIPAMPPADAMLQLNHYWGPLNILDNEMDFGFAMQFADFEGTNSLFMALDDPRAMQ